MFRGKIQTLKPERGFGFIIGQSHQDLFFHRSAMAQDSSFESLRQGTEVEYDTAPGKVGKLCAVNVHVINQSISAGQPANIPARNATNDERRHQSANVRQPAKTSAIHTGQRDDRFLNPYNFVRFLSAPPLENSTTEQQLLRCSPPPPHDRYVGLTGEIACTLRTVTPLFISDSEAITEDDQGHKSYRFFRINNQYAIPATALRGAVRNVFEAATGSCLTIFEGQRLSYHFNAQLAPTLVPGRVEKDGDEWTLRLLTGTARLGQDYAPEKGETLPAAWLYRYWPLEPSKTLLNDDPQGGAELLDRIYAFQDRADDGPVDLQGLVHGNSCFALLERTRHPHPRIIFWDVLEISRDRQSLELRKKGQQRVVEGWLCLTNQNIEPKHSERFFFIDQRPKTIKLPKEVRTAYEDLIKDYQERHDKERKEIRARAVEGTEVDLLKEPMLSRFILNDEERKLRGGELVYARLTGSIINPTIEFIAPVSVPRVSYKTSIAEIVERKHQHLLACDDYDKLCLACRVFGWVHQQPPKELERVAYAGRVRFSHANLTGEPRPLGAETLAILSSPKPTTTKFYLLDDQRTSASVNYDSANAKLRGRKFYRHHGTANPNEYRRATDAEHNGRDKQNRTVLDALDKDNEFTFTVQFENLAPVELGALLWALELDGECVQRLGFAKPLGFGSAKVEVTGLKVLDPAARYSSLDADGFVDATTQRTQCLAQFKETLHSLYGNGKTDFDQLENITDLRRLLKPPPLGLRVHYPRLEADPSANGEQFRWFAANNRSPALPLTESDEGLPLKGDVDRRR